MEVAAKKENVPEETLYKILFMIGFVHLLNDSIQAVIPAVFPILEKSMNLTYLQLGLITFSLQLTASILQPVVGIYTDQKPMPYLLPIGLTFTFFGMLGLAFAPNYWVILISVLFVGIGSAVFHPEGSRVVHLAAGEKKGLSQSIFQVGGNAGKSLAPLMTALIFVPMGQFGAIWFTMIAGLAVVVLIYIAGWYKGKLNNGKTAVKRKHLNTTAGNHAQMKIGLILLIFLVFARSWYHAAITNFYPFYLIKEHDLSISQTQIHIFIFLAAGALGTFLGGPLSDRFGRKNVIAFSMLGSAPLAIILPYVNEFWALPIMLINGFIILSSFSVVVVYAQELMPGKIGTASGLMVGLAFGLGALGSVALGAIADWIGLKPVMIACGFLPFIGMLSVFLPSDKKLKQWAS